MDVLAIRSMVVLFMLAGPAGASLISAYVNCGGASRTLYLSRPSVIPDPLRCSENDFQGYASIFSVLGVEAAAVPASSSATGIVEASVTVSGLFELSFLGLDSRYQGPWRAAFWSACISANALIPARPQFPGDGSASAVASLGSYSIGDPCDFAHAVPLLSRNFLPYDVMLQASGNAYVYHLVSISFFAADGSPPPIGYSYSFVATPEPSTAIAPLTAFIVFGLYLLGGARRRASARVRIRYQVRRNFGR